MAKLYGPGDAWPGTQHQAWAEGLSTHARDGMKEAWQFSLICTGIEDWTDEIVDRLREELDDAAFGAANGVLFVEVDRESDSALEAIVTAVEAIGHTGPPELQVAHVEPDELVTMADIAQRLSRSRESIRLWITGERGPGGFPHPRHNALGRSRLWRWVDVLEWIDRAGMSTNVSSRVLELAAAIDQANGELRARSQELSTSVTTR